MIFKNVRINIDDKLVKKDVLVIERKIARIDDEIQGDGIDCHNLYMCPGLVDIHVHFREPGFTSKESILTGNKAAVKGGYTRVFLMPNLNPVPDNLSHLAIEEEIIKRDAIIDNIPYGSVTISEKSMEVSDIENLSSHTRYFSDDGVGFSNYDVLEKALKIIKEKNLFIASHAEIKELGTIPSGEYNAVKNEIELAKKINVKYHFCHISTKESFDYIREAKREGYDITCEVTPHHLFLNETDIKNANFKMNPPLRSIENQKETLKALLDSTAYCIATDHAPHTIEEKSREYNLCPNGILGLETCAPLVYTNLVKTGIASYTQFEDWLSNNPNKLTSQPLNSIKVGNDANFCLLDIDNPHTYSEEEILSKGKNSPFIGMTLYGFNKMTVYLGRIVYGE